MDSKRRRAIRLVGPGTDLTIDKGDPKNFVSFCWDGEVTKTGPTTFEAKATEFFPPWEVIAAAWQWTIDRADPLQFINLALLLLFGVLLVIGAKRLPIAYTLYALPQFVLLATRIQPTPLTSTNRYLLVLFPAFVIVALIPWRRVRLAWAITSTLFLAILLSEFQRGSFVA